MKLATRAGNDPQNGSKRTGTNTAERPKDFNIMHNHLNKDKPSHTAPLVYPCTHIMRHGVATRHQEKSHSIEYVEKFF